MIKPEPPKDLSRRAKRTWRELTASHDFESHELIAFERSLKWQDVSDTVFAEAETKTGKDRAALLKLALDASNASLRFWRVLKFPPPVGARRPGRPAGNNWSEHRKRAANA